MTFVANLFLYGFTALFVGVFVLSYNVCKRRQKEFKAQGSSFGWAALLLLVLYLPLLGVESILVGSTPDTHFVTQVVPPSSQPVAHPSTDDFLKSASSPFVVQMMDGIFSFIKSKKLSGVLGQFVKSFLDTMDLEVQLALHLFPFFILADILWALIMAAAFGGGAWFCYKVFVHRATYHYFFQSVSYQVLGYEHINDVGRWNFRKNYKWMSGFWIIAILFFMLNIRATHQHQATQYVPLNCDIQKIDIGQVPHDGPLIDCKNTKMTFLQSVIIFDTNPFKNTDESLYQIKVASPKVFMLGSFYPYFGLIFSGLMLLNILLGLNQDIVIEQIRKEQQTHEIRGDLEKFVSLLKQKINLGEKIIFDTYDFQQPWILNSHVVSFLAEHGRISPATYEKLTESELLDQAYETPQQISDFKDKLKALFSDNEAALNILLQYSQEVKSLSGTEIYYIKDGVPNPFLKQILEFLGIQEFTTFQEQAIRSFKEGQHLAVCTPKFSQRNQLAYLLIFYTLYERSKKVLLVFKTESQGQQFFKQLRQLLDDKALWNVIHIWRCWELEADKNYPTDSPDLIFLTPHYIHKQLLKNHPETSWGAILSQVGLTVCDGLDELNLVEAGHYSYIMKRLRRLFSVHDHPHQYFVLTDPYHSKQEYLNNFFGIKEGFQLVTQDISLTKRQKHLSFKMQGGQEIKGKSVQINNRFRLPLMIAAYAAQQNVGPVIYYGFENIYSQQDFEYAQRDAGRLGIQPETFKENCLQMGSSQGHEKYLNARIMVFGGKISNYSQIYSKLRNLGKRNPGEMVVLIACHLDDVDYEIYHKFFRLGENNLGDLTQYSPLPPYRPHLSAKSQKEHLACTLNEGYCELGSLKADFLWPQVETFTEARGIEKMQLKMVEKNYHEETLVRKEFLKYTAGSRVEDHYNNIDLELECGTHWEFRDSSNTSLGKVKKEWFLRRQHVRMILLMGMGKESWTAQRYFVDNIQNGIIRVYPTEEAQETVLLREVRIIQPHFYETTFRLGDNNKVTYSDSRLQLSWRYTGIHRYPINSIGHFQASKDPLREHTAETLDVPAVSLKLSSSHEASSPSLNPLNSETLYALRIIFRYTFTLCFPDSLHEIETIECQDSAGNYWMCLFDTTGANDTLIFALIDDLQRRKWFLYYLKEMGELFASISEESSSKQALLWSENRIRSENQKNANFQEASQLLTQWFGNIDNAVEASNLDLDTASILDQADQDSLGSESHQ